MINELLTRQRDQRIIHSWISDSVLVIYQEVVFEELWQLQTDDVIVKWKKIESPLISGHICGREKFNTSSHQH